jgi:hypothetical protein
MAESGDSLIVDEPSVVVRHPADFNGVAIKRPGDPPMQIPKGRPDIDHLSLLRVEYQDCLEPNPLQLCVKGTEKPAIVRSERRPQYGKASESGHWLLLLHHNYEPETWTMGAVACRFKFHPYLQFVIDIALTQPKGAAMEWRAPT